MIATPVADTTTDAALDAAYVTALRHVREHYPQLSDEQAEKLAQITAAFAVLAEKEATHER